MHSVLEYSTAKTACWQEPSLQPSVRLEARFGNTGKLRPAQECLGECFLFSSVIGSGRTTVATANQIKNAMAKSLISALLLSVGVWLSAIGRAAEVRIERSSSKPPRDSNAVPAGPKLIAIRKDASDLESLAANEVRRYVYLRTGKLLPVKRGRDAGDRIVVSCKNSRFCGELGSDLGPQQFTLKTSHGGRSTGLVDCGR